MGKNIGKIYKYNQPQLSISSLKAPINLSSDIQASPAIKLITTSIPYVRDKYQINYVLYSQNTMHNDAIITNNDDIQSFETSREKKL